MTTAAWPVLGALGLLSCSFVLAKTGRDTLFFAAGGLRDLPLTYVAMAALSLPLGMTTLALMRRVGRRRATLVGMAGAACGLLLVSAALPAGQSVMLTVSFLAIPLVFGVLFSMAWLHVPDTIGQAAARPAQAYAAAGTASLVGGLAGGGLAMWLAPGVSARELVAIAAAVLSLSAGLLAVSARRRGDGRRLPSAAAPPPGVFEGPPVPPPRATLLMAFASLTGVVGVLVEYQFYTAASTRADGGPTADAFANLYLGIHAGAFAALQASSWLQRVGGLGGMLMLLPLSVSLLSSALWAGGGAGGRTWLRLAEGGLKASTHRVGWEQVFARVPIAQRTRLKLTVDGMATRLAEGATGIGLFVLVGAGASPAAVSGALVLAGGAWVLVTAGIWRRHLRDAPHDGAAGRLPDS